MSDKRLIKTESFFSGAGTDREARRLVYGETYMATF